MMIDRAIKMLAHYIATHIHQECMNPDACLVIAYIKQRDINAMVTKHVLAELGLNAPVPDTIC